MSWAAPGQPASVWLDVAREYTEFWLHQQQVRDGVGRSGANSDRLTWPVVDTFLGAGPHALRHPSPPPACTSRWPGPGDGSWTVQRQDAT